MGPYTDAREGRSGTDGLMTSLLKLSTLQSLVRSTSKLNL